MCGIIPLESDFLEPADTGPPAGFVLLLVLILVAGAALMIWQVSAARRMARRSGMNQDDAAAMTLLTDDGLAATYLAATLRDRPAQPPQTPVRSSADRLRELASLLDQGLIIQAEYDERRRAILEDL
jgi:hypothetical protein